MRFIIILFLNMIFCEFTGQTCISGNCNNGYGILEYERSLDMIKYYKGNFVNGVKHGNGSFIYSDGEIMSGEFIHGRLYGLCRMSRDGITRLIYWEDGDLSNDKGISYTTLKVHQDTVFKKYVRCNCLQSKKFSILSANYYDFTFYGKEVDGFVNNTNHNIFIRCYRKYFFKKRNVIEYVDDSYVVYPGQEIMGNYRIQPKHGESYSLYDDDEFIFIGQYCEKKASNCNLDILKTQESNVLYVGKEKIASKELIKKGSRLTISASGSITLGVFAGQSSPDGILGFDSYSIINKFKHGALLARIGDSGDWFLVGSGVTIVPKTTGYIQFLVNDSDNYNNNGEYKVELSIK